MVVASGNYKPVVNLSMKLSHIILFLFFLSAAGCVQEKKTVKNAAPFVPQANDEYFQDIGENIGLRFRHSLGDDELTNIIESSCGGTAFLDFDKDGFIDIYVTSGTWIEGFSHRKKFRLTGSTGIKATVPLMM